MLSIFTFYCSNYFVSAPRTKVSLNKIKLTAGTYNIHIGKGIDNQINLKRIADVIIENNTDVIGVQEVDRFTIRSGKIDQFEELKKLTNMNGIFGKSIDYQGGEFGIGIFTSGEILKWSHNLHPLGEEKERRSFIAALIATKDDFSFWAVNTHLGLVGKDRKTQANTIIEFVKSLKEPVILLGDFNEKPDVKSGIYESLSQTFLDCWLTSKSRIVFNESTDEFISKGYTYPSNQPSERIDYIWLRKNDGWETEKCWITKTQASDHLPFFVCITNNLK